MAEFILEDGKLITDGMPSDRKPSDINLRTGNRLMQQDRKENTLKGACDD